MGALIEHDRREHERQRDVHRRPHDQDLEALPFGLGQEFVRLARALVVRILAGHLHVAAERERADAVLGAAPVDAEHGGIEAKLELEHADADAFGGEKVPELVHEHEDAQHEGKRE